MLRRFLFIPLALCCFALSPVPIAFGVTPAPDGGYPGANTAEGTNALLSNTTGVYNTANGLNALSSNTTGNYNTANGGNALLSNTTASANTATGVNALLSNTTGVYNTADGLQALHSNTTGNYNTANGGNALYSNTTASFNDAVGTNALFSNTDGSSNNALGESALFSNIHAAGNTAIGDLALANNDSTGNGQANQNTAVGAQALFNNTDGDSNNAVGAQALTANTTGFFNEAMGVLALGSNIDGAANVAVGDSALTGNAHGSFNTVVGDSAGSTVEGDDNIYIGATSANGVTSESGTIRIGDPNFVSACFIAGINGQTASGGVAVFVDANGKLGTLTSSARFKDEIKPMDKASEAILALEPVTFRYKQELDPDGIPQFGLIAEQVEKVNPDLVVRDKQGKVYTVRYEAVNAMLLNEFLKEHRKVEQQEAMITHLKSTVAQQQKDFQATAAREQKQIEALTAGLQKVSAQVEMSKPAAQMVDNNQ